MDQIDPLQHVSAETHRMWSDHSHVQAESPSSNPSQWLSSVFGDSQASQLHTAVAAQQDDSVAAAASAGAASLSAAIASVGKRRSGQQAAGTSKRRAGKQAEGTLVGQKDFMIKMDPATLRPSADPSRGVQESRHFRLSRRLGRFSPLPSADSTYTEEQRLEGEAVQRWCRGAEGDMLSAQKNHQYVTSIARLETFILKKYPDTPAALRLHLVGHLGSDWNKDLDVLYREFVEDYGEQWEQLAGLSDNPELLPGEGNWHQFVIFRGFPVFMEDVFFSLLKKTPSLESPSSGWQSPSLDKISSAVIKLYGVFNVPRELAPGRDTEAWRGQIKEIRASHRMDHRSGINVTDHLDHLIKSIQSRPPAELHPNLGSQLIFMVESGVIHAHRRSEFSYYSVLALSTLEPSINLRT